MEKKNVTEVVIGGKIYKLGGYESEDYLHQVASYLNNRITELRALDGYNRLPSAQKSLMLDLNTADDYFKAKRQADKLEAELSEKDRELYEARHDLVSAQVKLEENQRTITSLKEEADDYQKKIALLEARLSQQEVRLQQGVKLQPEGRPLQGAGSQQEAGPQQEVRPASEAEGS